MNNQQFYLSPTKSHDCIKLPKKDNKYLLIDNYLSEFYTNEDKEKVLSNLGILLRLEALKNLIDLKVIELGGVAWDLVPTEGNTDHVLSSDALYNLLSKYYTQEEIDTKIEQLFGIFIKDFKVTTDNSLSDTSENPVLNKVIKQALDKLLDQINNIPGIEPSTNIKVDSELSETSENPLQNKVIQSNLLSIKELLQLFENALNKKIEVELLEEFENLLSKIDKNLLPLLEGGLVDIKDFLYEGAKIDLGAIYVYNNKPILGITASLKNSDINTNLEGYDLYILFKSNVESDTDTIIYHCFDAQGNYKRTWVSNRDKIPNSIKIAFGDTVDITPITNLEIERLLN